jgi:pilus assembly protein CpaE
MPITANPAKVLLVSTNQAIIDATRAALSDEDDFNLLDQEVAAGNLFSLIAKTQPDVILLDFGFQAQPFNLIDRLAAEHPDRALIAILSEAEMEHSDRVVLSGARAFIKFPFQPGKLQVTVKRVMELKQRNHVQSSGESEQTLEDKPRQTLAVFSPKGGAGTTTIATNLAISLHKTLKEEVLLIDGKHLFGHTALYLNLRTANSITDLIAHAGMLDQRLIDQVVIKHLTGINVLPSPNSIALAQGIRPDDLFKVIQSLQGAFPLIVIDAGNHLNDNAVTYLDAADRILLVFNPDLASMRDVGLFMEIASTLSYPKEKILPIVNLAGRKADVKSGEIENILKFEIFATIPADENLALSCINEGVPILQKYPRHRISKAYAKITKQLVNTAINPKSD